MRLAFSAPHFNPRSPHGERHDKAQINFGALKFQSTLPARGATWSFLICPSFAQISIHAPRTGSDNPPDEGPVARAISIHAPRTGSDRKLLATLSARSHFNPRSPHGERPISVTDGAGAETFQSTLPARGATRVAVASASSNRISIHAPRTGSDWDDINKAYSAYISIHAPRTGSDRRW